MHTSFHLWRSADLTRWFLFDAGAAFPPGDLALVAFDDRSASVDARWAALHEIGEAEGREWAREALGDALGELRKGIEARIAETRAAISDARQAPAAAGTEITPDAVPAILSLVRSLPGVVRDGLSGDRERVAKAGDRLVALQSRLNGSGIAVGDRLAGFAERLDRLRRETARDPSEGC